MNTGEDEREKSHTYENDDGETVVDETFQWMANKILDGVSTKRPTLEVFDETITSLHKTRDDINQLSQKVEIGWLSINA